MTKAPRLLLYQKREIWYVRVTWQDGSRQAVSLQTRDKADAEARLALFCRDMLPRMVAQRAQDALQPKGEPPTPDPGSSPLLRDLVDYYVDVHLPNLNAAQKSISSAAAKLYDFMSWCRLRHVGRADQLTRRTLDDYVVSLRGRGLSAKTLGNYLATIRAALNAAVDGERLDRNPLTKLPLPRTAEPEINPLTAEQLRAVVDAVYALDRRIAPAVEWIALTGNRPSDTLALLWRHVRLPERIVERTQTKSRRLAQYQISAAAAALLDRRPRVSDFVFPEPDGEQMTVHVLYRRFTRAVARSGLGRPVNLKDLRHTFGSLLANGSPPCPLPVLQVLMGHADIAVTMKYVHASDAYVYVDALAATVGLDPSSRGNLGTP